MHADIGATHMLSSAAYPTNAYCTNILPSKREMNRLITVRRFSATGKGIATGKPSKKKNKQQHKPHSNVFNDFALTYFFQST